MSYEIAGWWLPRCLCLLIVALAVTDPDYKIPNADECEQRSEETPNVNHAPLAERAVYHQIEPTMQRGVSFATQSGIFTANPAPITAVSVKKSRRLSTRQFRVIGPVACLPFFIN